MPPSGGQSVYTFIALSAKRKNPPKGGTTNANLARRRVKATAPNSESLYLCLREEVWPSGVWPLPVW